MKKETLFVGATILAVGFLAGWMVFGGQAELAPERTVGQSDYSTTVTAPYVFTEDVSYSGTTVDFSLPTTTVARSYDGFMVGGGIAPASVATGTVFTLYTHTGSPVVCDATLGAAVADNTTFGPALIMSVGTSTGGVATRNLIASTTFATSTDTYVKPTAAVFRMDAGDRINAILSDYLTASSTHFSNWDIEFQTQCWLIGG